MSDGPDKRIQYAIVPDLGRLYRYTSTNGGGGGGTCVILTLRRSLHQTTRYHQSNDICGKEKLIICHKYSCHEYQRDTTVFIKQSHHDFDIGIAMTIKGAQPNHSIHSKFDLY